MSNEDRAERLRGRRNRAKERAQESKPSDSSKPSKTSETSKTSERGKQGKSSKTSKQSETEETSVKDELVGTYMYLPESLKSDLDRFYKKLAGDFEYKTGDELEKNRHYYPLVVTHGFETIRGADIEEIEELLDNLGSEE